ncbi:YybS family protein [Neobacillus jeddahensis]|uniref:YybS family protein n=1 Tax=Neobacillus jeddahensis TaxID=1461580 RepID=UPI00058C1D7D|nr:YybS family protein [Neobacillus jeddahensis]
MKNVRKLTEGAILLAAFTVILLVVIYVPVLGPLLNFVLPLPFMMFAAKNNMKYIGAFFVAAILLSFIAGSLFGISIMLIYGAVGTVIGYMLQKNRSRNSILIAGSLMFIVGMIIFYVASAAFFHFNIIHELTEMLKESTKMSQDMLKALGNEEQIKQLNQQNANMIQMIQTLAPGALIIASIGSVFVIQWICFPIIKRFGISVQPWGKLRNLTLPKSLLWYYLIALGGMLLFHPQEGTYVYLALINARYILELFLVLQGMACLFYIFHQRKVAKGLGVFIAILTFIIPIIHYIIMLVGITDIGFDFRKRFEKKE